MQHQGQMDDAVDQDLARELDAREEISERERNRQAGDHAREGDLETEAEDLEFRGRKEHAVSLTG